MNEILTNQIIANIYYELILRDFIVCEYSTSEKFIKHGAKILDSIGEKLKAESIVFESGKRFYALFDRKNDTAFNDFVADKEFENISAREVSAKNIENHIIVRLFLNALINYDAEGIKFNNLTGKLFCSNPNWFVKSYSGEIRQFKCIEVSVSKDMNLNLDVSTFTSIKELGRLRFRKKKAHDYPAYDFVGLNMLKRIDWNNKIGFIKKQYENKKNRISFIDFSNWNNYSQSKCGVLYKVLNSLNEKFGTYLSIEMKAVNSYKTISCANSFVQTQDIDFQKPISIIDKLFSKDDSFIDSILKRLTDYGFKNTSKNCELVAGAYNIVVLNNKKFYEENADLIDPYFVGNHNLIQHITYEDFDDSNAVLNCIIKEMRIKQDVIDGKITYAKWQDLGFEEELYFCKKVSDTSFAFLKICNDGKMNFEKIESDILSNSQYQNIINQYNSAEVQNNAKIECLLYCDSFCCAIICTNGYTLPQIFEIGDALKAETKFLVLSNQELINALSSIKKISSDSHSQLKQIKEKIGAESKVNYGREEILNLIKNRALKKEISLTIENMFGMVLKTYFRGEERRNRLFSSNLNINYYCEDSGGMFYFVGEKNKGIKTTLQTASLIRRVIPIYGVISEKIFNLLSVDFVNKEQFTAIPFPVKYLREYCQWHAFGNKISCLLE